MDNGDSWTYLVPVLFNLCFDFGNELIHDSLDNSNITFPNDKLPAVSRLLGIDVSARVKDTGAKVGGTGGEDTDEFQVDDIEEEVEGGGRVTNSSVQERSNRPRAIKRSTRQVDDASMDPPAKKRKTRKKKTPPAEEVEGWVEKDLTRDDDDDEN